jgi:hypothetical protein
MGQGLDNQEKNQLGCLISWLSQGCLVLDNDLYCCPQSSICYHDKQALSLDAPKPAKAQPNPVIFFANRQTDVDLLTRDVQKTAPSESNTESAQKANLNAWLDKSDLLISRKPWLASSVSLSTISRTFHSLFRVLFIFPSRYLFAIGLSPIFSFRWNLPPILSCNPKQLDSLKRGPLVRSQVRWWTGLSPSMMSCSKELASEPLLSATLSWNYNSTKNVTLGRFQIWAFPASLAVTRGILVSFFSSAYLYA